jgi:CHAD domain-containing protein
VEVTAEHERKLEAPDGFELPALGGTPLEPRVFTSVYYDTADKSLAHAGITLRRRTENGRSVWQLKLPSDEARLELEQPGGPAEPPAELARLLTAHLRGGGVAPVAELRTRRRGELVARGGTTAEVTVDEVAIMDALRVADEFVEVEIELREGDPRRLDRIVKSVARAGAWPTNGKPKVFRALAFDPVHEPEDGAFGTLRARLHAQLGEILRHDPGTRLGTDPESLHDMRVAVRRSRALLRAGRPLLRTDTQVLAAELKWLGALLGDVRDLDVLLGRLNGEAAELDTEDRRAAHALLRSLERERKRRRATLLKALDGSRYLSLLDRLETTLAELEPTGSDAGLAALARRQLKRLRKTVRALDDEPADEALHDLRKRGRRARYAAELANQSSVVKRAKELQDVLGEHQDSVVAEHRLRALAANASPVQALAAGRLVELERARQASARAAWRAAWRRLDRAGA